MRERELIAHARDRLVVTAALLDRLHEQLRAGRLRASQADAIRALVAAQFGRALDSLEEAGDSLRRPPRQAGCSVRGTSRVVSRRNVSRPAS
jgi:hypothetical protein